jgi:hypothetical protein
MNAHERPVVTEENKTAVRGGATGNNVRYVLIGSVALAILAWILVARTDSTVYVAKPHAAGPARYGKMRPRLYSEKSRPTPRSCSSASSLEIERTAKAVRSSGQRDSYWTERWRKRASTAGTFT